MEKILRSVMLLLVAAVAAVGLLWPAAEYGVRAVSAAPPQGAAPAGSYLAIGWNDLGMHCLSSRFKHMAILPPYNDLLVQVIQVGNPPRLVTSGVTVSYTIPTCTTTVGKTDFWTYVGSLFGVALPEGIGLTGNGLAGDLQLHGDHFEATGIPMLPYEDSMVRNPYQTALVTVRDLGGAVLATTTVVIPTSDEMNCQRCHGDAGSANPGISTGAMEVNVMTLHDQNRGTNLVGNQPVLCASCHSDNALGTPGTPGVQSLSGAMHNRHGALAAAAQPTCYDCHPGAVTQCSRSDIEGMGPRGTGDPGCVGCHGNLAAVGMSINAGRIPWNQEPTCVKCHDPEFTTPGGNLYRQSRGHGGLYCSACHNSPHAWWPSMKDVDNIQPLALQGSRDSIGQCNVCHSGSPGSGGPHNSGLAVSGAAGLGRNWVYQNTPVTTGNRHRVVLTVTAGGTTRFTVQVAKISGAGEVVIQPGPDQLTWNILGGPRPSDGSLGSGPLALAVTITDVPTGNFWTVPVSLTVRQLGDIDGLGGVSSQDKLLINKRLNGLLPTGPQYDLDGAGGVSGQDKLILNKILNGMAIP